MKKQFFAIITASLIFILFSCKKDDNKSKTELLTQASWKFSTATAAGIDITGNAAITCIKDDVVTFASDGTGTVTEGTVVCSPTTAGNITSAFQDSESKLMMSAGLFPAGSGLFTIVALTETTLTLSQDVIIPPSSTAVPVSATYIH